MRVYVGGIFHLEKLCNIQCALIPPHKSSSVCSKTRCQRRAWHPSVTLGYNVPVDLMFQGVAYIELIFFGEPHNKCTGRGNGLWRSEASLLVGAESLW